ncbi:MAG: Ig-like domain-containing protein, partial [Synechococcus lacustris]
MTISNQGSFSIPSITVKSLNLSGSTSSTNPKPVANRTPRDVSESIITEKNKAISGNVLNNASDPDGDPLSITSFTLAGKTYSAGEIVNL